MLVRTKLRISVGALGLVAVIAAALLIWTTNRSQLNQTRMALAYEGLGGYLQLSGTVFQTFKQVRRDVLSGSEPIKRDYSDAEERISGILENIRVTAARESAFLRTSSVLNENFVRRLDNELVLAFEDLRTANQLFQTGQIEPGKEKVIGVLERRIDETVAKMIEMAIKVEESEVERSSNEIQRINQFSFIIAVILGVLSLLLTGFVLRWLVHRVQRSLVELETGVEKYADDELTHRIAIDGRDEFKVIGDRFNVMASQILRKRKDIESAALELEKRVQDSTQELRVANAELEQRDALRRQFFADIGHELRTPVTAIRGEAEVALRSKVDVAANRETALKTIVKITEQLTETVNELFLIAREQAGVLDLRHEPLDLREALQEAACQMANVARESQARLRTELPNDALWIDGTKTRVIQLVRILISNAITHAQHGVEVEISAYEEDGTAVLKVTDDGPGIPKSEQPRVFDRYYRGANDPLKKTTGTGLGLPIARSIATAHGAQIDVIDTEYRGTTIVTKFTLANAKEPS